MILKVKNFKAPDVKNNKTKDIMKKIVVNSNCTTGPIAGLLKCIFNDAKILLIPGGDHNSFKKILDLTADGGYIVLSLFHKELSTIMNVLNNKLIPVPNLYFTAFHPDLTYCTSKIDRSRYTIPNYNSQIILFAFENNLNIRQTLSLFSVDVFKQLGYFNRWDSDYRSLKNIFLQSDISYKEFDRFFNIIKRNGVFMHSVNHPKIDVLTQLTRILVNKFDSNIIFDDYTFNIPDVLINNYVFPVYPEIADKFSLNGNYSWSIADKNFNDLKSFIEFSFESYIDQKFNREDLSYSISDKQRNVLGEIVRSF